MPRAFKQRRTGEIKRNCSNLDAKSVDKKEDNVGEFNNKSAPLRRWTSKSSERYPGVPSKYQHQEVHLKGASSVPRVQLVRVFLMPPSGDRFLYIARNLFTKKM